MRINMTNMANKTKVPHKTYHFGNERRPLQKYWSSTDVDIFFILLHWRKLLRHLVMNFGQQSPQPAPSMKVGPNAMGQISFQQLSQTKHWKLVSILSAHTAVLSYKLQCQKCYFLSSSSFKITHTDSEQTCRRSNSKHRANLPD